MFVRRLIAGVARCGLPLTGVWVPFLAGAVFSAALTVSAHRVSAQVAAVPVTREAVRLSPQAQALGAALRDVRAGNWRAAAVSARPGGPIVRDIVEWHRLREGGQADFDTYRDFLSRRGDWPGLDLLRTRGEGSIQDTTPAADVVAWFAVREPKTGRGVQRLLAAHGTRGETGDEHVLAVLAWRTMTLSPTVEAWMLRRYPTVLAAHHAARLDYLLWQGKLTSARRMFPLVEEGEQALAEARIALSRQAPGVDALIEAIPEPLADHPGLTYERFLWRAKKGRSAEAIELLQEASARPDTLGEPSKWANWRRSYARQLMRAGKGEAAYQLASRHFLSEGSAYADLEWLAGFISLRLLEDPELALYHFERFEAGVKTPISLGRAGYWRGRALRALGDRAGAASAFAAGARHQTSFYGLLSAQAVGLPLDPAMTGRETFPAIPRTSLSSNSVLVAALLLLEAGEETLAERFLTHLVEDLPRPEAGALGRLLLDLGEDHIALMVGKRAASKGMVLPAAYFPLSGRLTDRDLPVEPALALAITRRESEFDPVVVSPAGARGLMQLMPGTARDVSADLGVDYDLDGLLQEPRYNVTLGSTYLAQLIESFGPAPVLVSVGYNAGPRRASSWVADRGDPRSAGVDIIDWIEMIPFRETRNYVMRVSESVYIYRARLTGKTGPVRFLEYLQRG